jgi:16S rRNA U516 pseudouridylate synthase RsuA-like enzyme
MRGITIKLPEATMKRLRRQARATGRTVADLVRERLAGMTVNAQAGSVYAITDDVAGSLTGSRRAATNARRRFHRP